MKSCAVFSLPDYLSQIPEATLLLACLAFRARDDGFELCAGGEAVSEAERALSLPNEITSAILAIVLGFLLEATSLHRPQCKNYFPHHYQVPRSSIPNRKLLVSQERGWKVAKKLDCVSYFECSTVSGVGVSELFSEAIRLGLEKRRATRPEKNEKKKKIVRPCAIQ